MKLTHQILQAPLMCGKPFKQILAMEQLQISSFPIQGTWKQNTETLQQPHKR